MKTVKFLAVTFVLFLAAITGTRATWSIIVIDPKTKAIGIAGASCTQSVYGIGAIIPGKGAVVVQAMSNGNARRKGREMIMAGDTPAKIIEAMRNPEFDPENQQYAVVTAAHMDAPATYTGASAYAHKGALTASGISVQGNMLTHPEELQSIMDAALKAQKEGLPLEDILMQALEAGANAGGDKRCGEIKASSAFVTVMLPADNPRQPFMNLIVNQQDQERINAVNAVRRKFDNWKKAQKQ